MSNTPTLPRQARARATRASLVEATVDLLRHRPFEQLSVAEIAAAANVTTGALYGHFGSKDGLLPAIYEYYDAQLGLCEDETFGGVTWESLDLRQTVDRIADMLTELYRAKPWLIRAAALFARAYPERVPREAMAHRAAWFHRLAEPLRRHAADVAHEDADVAIQNALYLLITVIREAVLFGAAPVASAAPNREGFPSAAAHAAFAYLTTASPRTEGSGEPR